MRKLLIFAFAVGCSNGSDEKRTFHGTQALDRATLENQVYYIDLSVADTPLTAEEVQDVQGAIPVRLLAGDDFVAAIGQDPALGPCVMDRLMGVWKLELVPNGGIDPDGEGDSTGNDNHQPPGHQDRRDPNLSGTTTNGAVLVVEWNTDVNGITPEQLDVLIDFHPGCI